MLPGTEDDVVQFCEVQYTLLRLNVFPANTAQERVDVGILHLLPDGVHVLGRGQRRVLELAGEHEERLALDVQLLGPFIWHEAGDLRGRHDCGLLVWLAWKGRTLIDENKRYGRDFIGCNKKAVVFDLPSRLARGRKIFI